MWKETYVNMVKSQFDKMDNSNCIIDIYWFQLIDIWDLSTLDKENFLYDSRFLFECNLCTELNM